eukprot:461769_1
MITSHLQPNISNIINLHSILSFNLIINQFNNYILMVIIISLSFFMGFIDDSYNLNVKNIPFQTLFLHTKLSIIIFLNTKLSNDLVSLINGYEDIIDTLEYNQLTGPTFPLNYIKYDTITNTISYINLTTLYTLFLLANYIINNHNINKSLSDNLIPLYFLIISLNYGVYQMVFITNKI